MSEKLVNTAKAVKITGIKPVELQNFLRRFRGLLEIPFAKERYRKHARREYSIKDLEYLRVVAMLLQLGVTPIAALRIANMFKRLVEDHVHAYKHSIIITPPNKFFPLQPHEFDSMMKGIEVAIVIRPQQVESTIQNKLQEVLEENGQETQ